MEKSKARGVGESRPASDVPSSSTPDEPSGAAEARPRIRSRALTGLLVLGVLYTAYFAKPVLIPIALAMLLTLLLGPLVQRLKRYLRLPVPVGAVLVVVSLVAAIATSFVALSGPATDWAQRLPQALEDLEEKIQPLRQPVEELQEAAKKVEKATRDARPSPDAPVAVVLKRASLTEVLLGETTAFSLGFFLTAFLLLFLLASGDTLLRQAVTAAPGLTEKKRVIEIAREIRDDISHYLVTISLINCGLGVAVGTAMWATGMPNPLLWGVMAGALNFMPYLGSAIGIGVVALVAVATFDTLLTIILPPLSYLVLTSLEGNVVTPALVAQRLVLNPVAVFIALMTATWMWGAPGALLAVPLLATFKIVCDHVDSCSAIGIMLGRPNEPAATKVGG